MFGCNYFCSYWEALVSFKPVKVLNDFLIISQLWILWTQFSDFNLIV